jgi:murein DD-endopeptidase MepM/ murein hydrolase activator NlpD
LLKRLNRLTKAQQRALRVRLLVPVSVTIFSVAIFWMGGGIPGGGNAAPQPVDAASPTAPRPIDTANNPYRVEEVSVAPRSTVFSTLSTAGVSSGSIVAILAAAKPLQNLARVAAGTAVSLAWASEGDSEPSRLEFKVSQERSLVVEGKSGDKSGWSAHFKEAKLSTRTVAFTGVVTSNLWNSATSAGMDPLLIHRLAEIFAWQVDFNREVQLDDRWRITVEQQFADSEPIGWGDIIAAEYENAGTVFSAVRFANEGFKNQYYAPDGNSLRRLFLKSPLKYGRITSGFSAQRFHPILKVNKAHRGVDYGAPTGTPIMAVGNGVVKFVGPRGGSGKMVQIHHNATYETAYKHMSRFAAGIVPGARVEMGQVIGYVGSTGLATGPHLHFEFFENGRYVDPQGLKFPSADPVPEALAAEFKTLAQNALATLPPWSKGVLTEEHQKSDQRSASAAN